MVFFVFVNALSHSFILHELYNEQRAFCFLLPILSLATVYYYVWFKGQRQGPGVLSPGPQPGSAQHPPDAPYPPEPDPRITLS